MARIFLAQCWFFNFLEETAVKHFGNNNSSEKKNNCLISTRPREAAANIALSLHRSVPLSFCPSAPRCTSVRIMTSAAYQASTCLTSTSISAGAVGSHQRRVDGLMRGDDLCQRARRSPPASRPPTPALRRLTPPNFLLFARN